jgi:hypothetical protein
MYPLLLMPSHIFLILLVAEKTISLQGRIITASGPSQYVRFIRISISNDNNILRSVMQVVFPISAIDIVFLENNLN